MYMMRMWSGGIYEDERFYNLCDKLEIMILQEFLFALTLTRSMEMRTLSVGINMLIGFREVLCETIDNRISNSNFAGGSVFCLFPEIFN